MNKTLERVLHEIEALPDGEQARIARVLEAELRKARGEEEAASVGRWARLVERMRREAPLEGRSEEVLRRVRAFRDQFDLRPGSAGGGGKPEAVRRALEPMRVRSSARSGGLIE